MTQNSTSWTNDELLPERLRRQLRAGLPGAGSRQHCAPQLCYGRHEAPPPANCRLAAVLLLLYRNGRQWHLPLTRRPESLTTHSGQVSLPGGAIDPEETPEDAATRELAEELGVIPDDLDLVGRLSPIYVYASNFYVTPCIAATHSRPEFIPNPAEVANLLEPSLVELFDRKCWGTRQMERRGTKFTAPEIVYDGESIWGATRMILAELCTLIGQASTATP